MIPGAELRRIHILQKFLWHEPLAVVRAALQVKDDEPCQIIGGREEAAGGNLRVDDAVDNRHGPFADVADGTGWFLYGLGLMKRAGGHLERRENFIAHKIGERFSGGGFKRKAGEVDTLIGILESFTRRKFEPRIYCAFDDLLKGARVVLRVGRVAERG